MTERPPRLMPLKQRHELLRVGRYETPDFGVIVDGSTGRALVRRGYAIDAKRRWFARSTGVCIRLTAAGRDYAKGRG